jgi:ectoine hydroxylase-related dioxygenase (phytanoyl-CoA dioxygenase family)
MLDRQQKQAFAEQGYVVVPQLVSRPLLEAARREIESRMAQEPPPAGHLGPHMYFLMEPFPDSLRALLFDTPALRAVESLIQPGTLEAPDHVQISLNVPPFPHRPGGPHLDGLTPLDPSGRPGTFTMLAGIFLTDQTSENAGNLWVWPGSHRSAAAYFRERGPDAILSLPIGPYPPIDLGEPRQVVGRAGDLLLAHYLLGHNIGGNTSGVTREVIYFRLRREGHRQHWADFLQDPLLEFGPVRAAVEAALAGTGRPAPAR